MKFERIVLILHPSAGISPQELEKFAALLRSLTPQKVEVFRIRDTQLSPHDGVLLFSREDSPTFESLKGLTARVVQLRDLPPVDQILQLLK